MSHILEIPLFNPSVLFCRDSTQSKNPTSNFQIGDSLTYINESYNEILDMVDINVATKLNKSIRDDEGTGVLTKRNYYILHVIFGNTQGQ